MKIYFTVILVCTILSSCGNAINDIKDSIDVNNQINEAIHSINSNIEELEKAPPGELLKSLRNDGTIDKYIYDTSEMVPNHLQLEVDYEE